MSASIAPLFPADQAKPPGVRHWDRAVGEVIGQEMRHDPSRILIGLEVTHYQPRLVDEFGPRRVIDTPVSESSVVGLAVGAARAGLKPIVDLWHGSFVYIALDQIVNGLLLSEQVYGLPAAVLLRMRTGVPVRTPGTSHARMPHGLLSSLPGLQVVMPARPEDAAALMRDSIRSDRPTAFLEHIDLCKAEPTGPDDDRPRLGSAAVVRRGSDVTVVAMGGTVRHALEAAGRLAASDVDAEVVDVRTLQPVDRATLTESVRRTRRLVVVDEAHDTASYGRWLAATLAQEVPALHRPPACVTVRDDLVPYSPRGVERGLLPDADRVEAAVRGLLARGTAGVAGAS